MKAEDLEGNVAKNYPTLSCQTFDIHAGQWSFDSFRSRRSHQEHHTLIPRILGNSGNNEFFWSKILSLPSPLLLSTLLILLITSQLSFDHNFHNSSHPPFKFFFSLRNDGRKNFSPRLFSREERIVKIKKEKCEGERKKERRGVGKQRSARTGCNSQIYYFSPLGSGAYFMPKRQTGRAARTNGEGNEYLSCFVAFLRPRDILVDR